MGRAELPAQHAAGDRTGYQAADGPGPAKRASAGRAGARGIAGSSLLRLLLAGSAALALSACEPGATSSENPPAAGAAAGAKPQRSTRIVDRDVEAPQVFQVTEEALWDGRPSLGGVWVASPDVTDPERVIMRNPANGKFVIGALFKRERDNPGPKLQISSDAAEALGLLAGQPARLSVTALRREQAEEASPTSPVLDSNESIAAAGAIDAGGVQTAALDAPAAGKPAAPGAKPGKAAGKADAKAASGRSPSETAAAASAAIGAAETGAAPGAKPAAGAKPADATKPAAPAAPAASGQGGKPIQIGFFSVEENAKRAADKLAKAGIQAQTRKESASGKDYWTVFARGDAALLKKIKAAGFADAYMLK